MTTIVFNKESKLKFSRSQVRILIFKWKSSISIVAHLAKNLSAMWKTWVQFLGWEDPLEKGKATRSSILASRIPWTVQSVGLQRVRATFTFNEKVCSNYN